MLAHWNYYNPYPWPQSGEDHDRLRICLAGLAPEQLEIVMDTVQEPEVLRHQALFKKYVEDSGRSA